MVIINEAKDLSILNKNSDVAYCSEIQRTDSKYCFTFLIKRIQANWEQKEYVFISIGCNSKPKATYWYSAFKKLCNISNELRSSSKRRRITSKSSKSSRPSSLNDDNNRSLSDSRTEKSLTPKTFKDTKNISQEYYTKMVTPKSRRTRKLIVLIFRD